MEALHVLACGETGPQAPGSEGMKSPSESNVGLSWQLVKRGWSQARGSLTCRPPGLSPPLFFFQLGQEASPACFAMCFPASSCPLPPLPGEGAGGGS